MDAANIVALCLAYLVCVLVQVWLFQWLWNSTMPTIFGLKKITDWQSLRLLVMAAILSGKLFLTIGPQKVSPIVVDTGKKAITPEDRPG